MGRKRERLKSVGVRPALILGLKAKERAQSALPPKLKPNGQDFFEGGGRNKDLYKSLY
jgi:hypothetical protein